MELLPLELGELLLLKRFESAIQRMVISLANPAYHRAGEQDPPYTPNNK